MGIDIKFLAFRNKFNILGYVCKKITFWRVEIGWGSRFGAKCKLRLMAREFKIDARCSLKEI